MIEMFIVLVVLAVVMAMGAPALSHWLRQAEIRSSAESLRSALQKARTEAIGRNTKIIITISDAIGHPIWTMGCVGASNLCPAILHTQRAPSDSGVRWGAVTSAGAGNLSVALAAGAALPADVIFSPLGDAPRVANGKEIARVDVMHAGDATVGRLVLRIDGAGNIRVCDPSLATTDVRGCH